MKVETVVDMIEGKILGRVVDGIFVPIGHEACPTNPVECDDPNCWRPWPDSTPKRRWWW